MKHFLPFPEPNFARRVASVFLPLLLLGAASASAQTLTWGINGNGGAGNWGGGPDWWNGSTNVPWVAGDNAIFAVNGSVVSIGGAEVAAALTFNSSGYTIQGGPLESSSSGLTITTNSDATISAEIAPSGSVGNSLVKEGTGTLTFSGIGDIASVAVDQGQYLWSSITTIQAPDFTLANTAGVTLTLGMSGTSVTAQSLSGGGSSGGVVQPDTQARTLTLTVESAGNFGGVLQNNGSGILAVTFDAGQTLTNTNTYTGATTVTSGTLTLSGNGSVANSTLTVAGGLVLDNSATANANRISSTAILTLKNGQLQLIGNATTAVQQNVGSLDVYGASTVTVTPGAASTQISFAGLTRTNQGTLNIASSGVAISGLSNGASGILSPAITMGNDWAVAGGGGAISAYAAYNNNINAAASTDNVKLTPSGTTSLAAPTAIASLNLQNSDTGNAQVLDLGTSQNLGLSTGGILSSGAGTSTIQNGNLTTSGTSWYITANNNLTISSPILEAGSATTLVKTGTGTLTLSGNNTYAGLTALNQGTLVVSSDNNLGTNSSLELNGGTLTAGAGFSSPKTLTSGTLQNANINTNGFNVTFAGDSNASITKTGAGTLTLSNATSGAAATVQAGTLAFPNGGGFMTLQGGVLQAATSITSLNVQGNSTLDIGGPGAASLNTEYLLDGSGAVLTINYGVGSGSTDQFTITEGTVGIGSGTALIEFNFEDLGGTTTGVSYSLMSFPALTNAPSASQFEIAPEAAAEGWAGTFQTTTSGVAVEFTATPEPGSAALLACGVVAAFAGRRRPGPERPSPRGLTAIPL